LRFGLYYEMQTPPGTDHHRAYRDALDEVEAADRLGFDVLTVVEHHGHEQFSISANPLAFFSAVAQRAPRLRFRTAVHTLPLHNPMRLAAEIAVADILTDGRLECGVGRGHPWVLLAAGIPLEESRPRFEEVLAILDMAWREGRVTYAGRFHTIRDQVVVPRPVQRPHPRLWSPIRDVRAGQRGWGALTAPVYPAAETRQEIDAYVATCRAHGHAPDVAYLRAVYLDEDADRARKDAAPFVRNFFAYNVAPRLTLPPKDVLERAGYGNYTTGKLEALAELDLDAMLEQGIVFVGTPEQVAAQVARVGGIPGVTEFGMIAHFGGIDHARVLRTLRLFADRVMPAVAPASADGARSANRSSS
jgi:alkanesulfonate monooxygenase SsuD/methylene tetrahydromethanopterin reductase-like flavin-dependent oxidoreductase (luciferase family)